MWRTWHLIFVEYLVDQLCVLDFYKMTKLQMNKQRREIVMHVNNKLEIWSSIIYGILKNSLREVRVLASMNNEMIIKLFKFLKKNTKEENGCTNKEHKI